MKLKEYICPRCHKDHGSYAICGIMSKYCDDCNKEMKTGLNADYIKKKLEEIKQNTTFTSEEHNITNEEVDKLNALPEDIKKIIKMYCDDEWKDGYLEGAYQVRCSIDGELI